MNDFFSQVLSGIPFAISIFIVFWIGEIVKDKVEDLYYKIKSKLKERKNERKSKNPK